jgi:alanine racemase
MAKPNPKPRAATPPHSDARPLWGELDLDAITHNIGVLRERIGRLVKIIAPVKANAYGHGMEAVSLHLQRLGVDGLATANFDDAVAARRAGVTLPILMYGSQLPSGHGLLLQHGLTPSVYSRPSLEALAALSSTTAAPIAVHVKVDCGLGRLGVRLDEAAEFVRQLLTHRGLFLEGIYTHIPFSDPAGADWSRRQIAAFNGLVRAIEAEHGIKIPFAQGAASSVLADAFPDALNTVSPGHLLFGLSPINGLQAETLGFRKALRALRAQLIHIGRRQAGDDMIGTGEGGLAAAATTGVVLLGMNNGLRPAVPGKTAMVLCHGQRCPVLAVSAEYAVIDLSAVSDPQLGDTVTLIGSDGQERITVEDVAAHQGAPSAAYWQVGLRNVPMVTDLG